MVWRTWFVGVFQGFTLLEATFLVYGSRTLMRWSSQKLVGLLNIAVGWDRSSYQTLSYFLGESVVITELFRLWRWLHGSPGILMLALLLSLWYTMRWLSQWGLHWCQHHVVWTFSFQVYELMKLVNLSWHFLSWWLIFHCLYLELPKRCIFGYSCEVLSQMFKQRRHILNVGETFPGSKILEWF